jgi:hypothetical protein
MQNAELNVERMLITILHFAFSFLHYSGCRVRSLHICAGRGERSDPHHVF